MKGRTIPYSVAELNWIQAHSRGERRAMHAEFCAKFGRDDVNLINLNSLCKRKGWMTGRTGKFLKGQESHNKGNPFPARGRSADTQFKNGGVPHNTNFIGHERKSKDGYVEISVAEVNPHTGADRRYVQKHRWLWEKINGPVPEKYRLKCLDGDRINTDPSNWEAIPMGFAPRLNGRFGRGYDAAPNELKPAIMAVTKLEHAVREAKKG